MIIRQLNYHRSNAGTLRPIDFVVSCKDWGYINYLINKKKNGWVFNDIEKYTDFKLEIIK